MRKLKYSLLVAYVLMSTRICAVEAQFGIFGGLEVLPSFESYLAFVYPNGSISIIPTDGSLILDRVAINYFQSLVGGRLNSLPYAAFVSPTGELTPLSFDFPTGSIRGVGMNLYSQGIIGGQDTSFLGMRGYAALVSPSGVVSPVDISLPVGIINSVAINRFGQGIVGGEDLSGATPSYAALVSPTGSVTPITPSLPTGRILTVAINASGKGIIGGRDTSGPQPPYAALVSPSGTATALSLGVASGTITAVAINDSGQGIIGGADSLFAYAALVSPSGSLTPLTLIPSGTPAGSLGSVAINTYGKAIIGGKVNNAPYAAFVSQSGEVQQFSGFGTPSARIYQVAINELGQGLVLGEDETVAFGPGLAYLVSSDGILTVVPVSLPSARLYLASLLLFPTLPTSGLSGNNLAFANYINQNIPKNIFYFVLSIYDGTLAAALESAAPTRNAISSYTASSNLFYLTTSLSNRSRQSMIRKNWSSQRTTEVSDGSLMAFLSPLGVEESPESNLEQEAPHRVNKEPEKKADRPQPRGIWFQAIGSLAYQKSQDETPGLNPTSGGAVAAYEKAVNPNVQVGGGASYLFTHIHEENGQGHSNINQENVFLYGSWQEEENTYYIDGALWAGVFQIDQVRNIHMTGFNFRNSSDPNGWQFLPHAEIGRIRILEPRPNLDFILNPFIMADWANAWQEGFKEKGGGPFSAEQKPSYSSLLRVEAGLNLFEVLFLSSGNLIFQQKASYVSTHSFSAGKVKGFLIGSPGSFTLETLTAAQNLGAALFLMKYEPRNSRIPSSTILYQGEFGAKFQSHQLNVGIDWSF